MHGCFPSEGGVDGGQSGALEGGEGKLWLGCKNKQTNHGDVNREDVDCGIHSLLSFPSGQLRCIFSRAASHTARDL